MIVFCSCYSNTHFNDFQFLLERIFLFSGRETYSMDELKNARLGRAPSPMIGPTLQDLWETNVDDVVS